MSPPRTGDPPDPPPAIDGMPHRAPSPLPVLTTPRLRLRPMTPADVDDLFAIYGDPEVMRHASDPPFASREVVWRMLASVEALWAEGSSLEWGVAERDGGVLVGTCGLHGFDTSRRDAEIGCLLRRDRWGLGLMREALEALMGHARTGLGLHRLAADVDPANVRSLRLFARLGFAPDGDGRLHRPL